MKITYDPNIKLAGIAIVPWNRLGPEQFFPNYAIASLYGWDVGNVVGLPRLASLTDRMGQVPNLPRFNTTALFGNADFQQLLDEELPGYDLLTYRPVHVPEALRDRKVLMVDESFTARFENKVEFRQMFAGQLPFPDYKVYDRADLRPTEESFREVVGDSPKVIQDEQLSGGKGSFVVRNLADYEKTLAALAKLSAHGRVVVSRLIEGARERTIQACVTKDGVFTGPLQRQVVAHPALANKAVVEGDKFCGAQILSSDQSTELHRQAGEFANIIGQSLASKGYKGIFGVDYLLGQDNKLYVLEVNPRITGVTPLLTALFKDEDAIPFYLLHILELGGYPYMVEDYGVTFDQTGAILLMHALELHPVEIVSIPPSGTYSIQNGVLTPSSQAIDLKRLQQDEFIIQGYMAAGMTIKPGGRLLTIQFKEQILDENTDELYNKTIETITAIRQQLELRPVTK